MTDCIVMNDERFELARNCALCGKSFPVSVWSTETICPACKELWAKIKEKYDDRNKE